MNAVRGDPGQLTLHYEHRHLSPPALDEYCHSKPHLGRPMALGVEEPKEIRGQDPDGSLPGNSVGRELSPSDVGTYRLRVDTECRSWQTAHPL